LPTARSGYEQGEVPIRPAPPPRATVGQVAWLRVLAIDRRGALLNAGLPTELLLPRDQMVGRLSIGEGCLVMVHLDRGRPVATMHLDRFVSDVSEGLHDGDRVSLVIADPTDLGVKAVVDHRFWGLLYADTLFRTVRKGQRLDGWVLRVREDGRLDLTLREPGYAAVDPLTDRVLERLKAGGGFLPLTDRSPPEVIHRAFGVSKKQFKQAVGALYRRRRIVLEGDGIRLIEGTEGQ
jgi:uncharacterized protein